MVVFLKILQRTSKSSNPHRRKPMKTDRTPKPKKKPANTRRSAGCAASPCSAWLDPAAAPHDGTPILGDFGWPWACLAVWDEYDCHWCVGTIQRSPMADGPDNTWLECETEGTSSLKRWMPLPSLPNVRVVAPPPLESDCAETEKLMGGCSPTSCSPS